MTHEIMQGYELHLLEVGREDFRNYVYIIVDRSSRHAAIVDPAWDFEQIRSCVEKYALQLTAVLLTHSHDDHVNLVEEVVRHYHPTVYISRTEALEYGYTAPNLHLLGDQDSVSIGSTRIEALHTPGHTAGGMCYLLPDCALTGDTLFIEGCGRCDLIGSSVRQMYESLQRLKRRIPPEAGIYPGHSFGERPGRRFDEVLRQNIYLQLEEKHFAAFRMRKQQTGPVTWSRPVTPS